MKKFGNRDGSMCRHILKHMNDRYRLTNAYASFRSNWKSAAEFECFENAMLALEIYKNEEMAFIGNIILTVAASRGSVCGDEIYDIYGEASKPQVMSAAWSLMKTRGLITLLRRQQSQRDRNRSDQGVYRLTEMGERVMQNLCNPEVTYAIIRNASLHTT